MSGEQGIFFLTYDVMRIRRSDYEVIQITGHREIRFLGFHQHMRYHNVNLCTIYFNNFALLRHFTFETFNQNIK